MENDDIPEMRGNYESKGSVTPENNSKMKEEMEKTKKELDKVKDYIIKKHPFTEAIGIIPPQGIKFFIEEEEVPKETEKHMHLIVIIPEEQFKNIKKVQEDLVKQVESIKQKIWIHVKTPVDIWEYCLDSKFEIASAISMSYPIFDKGILGALRVSEIHKSLVLRKFERYVVSYVIGGSLVRGEAVKTSDVDVFIIINDTDVKRMPRLELKEKLRSIIHQYVAEAGALAGVKNKLSPQIYLLTDFWESVKDAHPVIFTFIRDGIPIYDRGTFMPWKVLLKMGKLKPSPESIDMFMSMGDKTVSRVKRTLLDLVVGDIFWGVITPSQALLMLYGLPPPNVKETVKEMKRVFVDEEKMLEKKYTDILEEIAIKYYKGYEHEKIKEVSGKEVDKLLKDTEDYLKRLKELRVQIEKRTKEKTIDQMNKEVFEILSSILGKKQNAELVKEFESKLIKQGKFTRKHLGIINDLLELKKSKKHDMHKVEKVRKDVSILINSLIEYTQRCDLVFVDRGKMKIKYKEKDSEKVAELLNAYGKTFLFKENSVHKITTHIENTTIEEVNEAVAKQKEKKSVEINPHVFEVLKKELGNFEIVL